MVAVYPLFAANFARIAAIEGAFSFAGHPVRSRIACYPAAASAALWRSRQRKNAAWFRPLLSCGPKESMV
jgi:hypothetical protein